MHTLPKFALTLAQLLVWGYVFGACVLAANAQAHSGRVPRNESAAYAFKIFAQLPHSTVDLIVIDIMTARSLERAHLLKAPTTADS